MNVLLSTLCLLSAARAQSSSLGGFCNSGSEAVIVSALSDYAPAFSFCSERFATIVFATSRTEITITPATQTITQPASTESILATGSTSILTLTSTATALFTSTSTSTLLLPASGLKRRRSGKQEQTNGQYTIKGTMSTPHNGYYVAQGDTWSPYEGPSTAVSSSNGAAAGQQGTTIIMLLALALTQAVTTTVTETEFLDTEVGPFTIISITTTSTAAEFSVTWTTVTTSTPIAVVTQTCRYDASNNIVPNGNFDDNWESGDLDAPWIEPLNTGRDPDSQTHPFAGRPSDAHSGSHSGALPVDSFFTPLSTLQQDLTNIDTGISYTFSFWYNPQYLFARRCYLTTTWGTIVIDARSFDEVNGTQQTEFTNINVPNVVQPFSTPTIRFTYTCDFTPGGFDASDIVLDDVVIVPSLEIVC
ncbi:hypothetical protein SCUP234_11653 [Seiridium cupressi]